MSIVMDEVFPLREGIDYKKLKLTEEGEYSVTRRRDADRIISVLNSNIKDIKSKSITDSTGCVGGDTIHFALNFKKVDSIEINSKNFEALRNNVNVYGLTNVSFHLGNSISIFDWKTDVLYIDPPWGGPNYKDTPNLDLYMSSKRIDEWVEEILLRKNRPDYIVLKLPQNFNFKRFNFLSNIEIIRPYRIRSYILLIITVHMPKL
jgi:predicted RNA methylase